MKPRQQVSRAAIDLIKRFEGYRRKAARLADGRWTIGYGHTLTARQGAEVSEKDAEALLIYDLIGVAHAVNEWTYTPLTQNQFDALCAFAFNIGVENFRGSAVLRRINEGDLLQAALAMELWRRAEFEGERIIVDALVRRRSAEKLLFLTPTDGFIPVPSPVLRPNLDLDSMGLVPREAPTPLKTPLDGPLAMAERETQPEPEPSPEARLGPAQAAAAAVSARLSAIFPDEEPAPRRPEPKAPEADQADANRTAVTEPTVEPAPPQQAPPVAAHRQWSISATARATGRGYRAAPVDAATAAAAAAAKPANESELETLAPASQADTPFAAALEPARRQRRPRRDRAGAVRLAILAILGLGLFGGGLWLGSNRGGDDDQLLAALGWLACLLGVILFSAVAYAALNRLGRATAEYDPHEEA